MMVSLDAECQLPRVAPPPPLTAPRFINWSGKGELDMFNLPALTASLLAVPLPF